MDAGARGVERQLADRDAHAVRAEVAQAEDPLAVGDDDDRGVAVRPVAQDALDAAAVVGADEQAARPLEDVAELLAGETHRRRVDDRQHLVRVVDDDPEEQRLVAVVQRGEVDVLVEGRRLLPEVRQHPAHLLVQRADVRGQQPADAQRVALGVGERGALVERRVAQQRDALRKPLGDARARTARFVLEHGRSPAARVMRKAGCRARRKPAGLPSDRLRHHLDRAARAFRHADAAALAVVVVELEALARPELDHRVVRADAVAVVALEAVAAGQAAARLEQRVGLVEALDDLVERRRAADDVEQRAHGLRRVAVIPGIELLEGRRARASAAAHRCRRAARRRCCARPSCRGRRRR